MHCWISCNKIFKIRPYLTIFWQKQFKSFLLSWNVCLVKYVRLEQLWKLMEKIAPTTIYMHRTTIYVSWTYYKDSYNKIYVHGTNYIKLCNKYLYTLEVSYELAEWIFVHLEKLYGLRNKYLYTQNKLYEFKKQQFVYLQQILSYTRTKYYMDK